MKVTHKVSFPGLQEFEQHTGYFEIDAQDVSAEILGKCNLLEKMFALNVLVLYEGLLFQLCEGFINKEEMGARRKRIFGLLSPKVEQIVKEVLKNGGTTERDTK